MERHAIVAKTQKGEEEIQRRAHGLDRTLRYVLILVDGRSTVQQLLEEKGLALPDVEGSLRKLQEAGFITIGGVGGVAAAGTAAEPGCVVPAHKDPAALKAELIAIAKEVLGADAAKIVSKLEAAPNTPDGLQETVNSCKKMVKLLIDEKKAEALMARCSSVLKDF